MYKNIKIAIKKKYGANPGIKVCKKADIKNTSTIILAARSSGQLISLIYGAKTLLPNRHTPETKPVKHNTWKIRIIRSGMLIEKMTANRYKRDKKIPA